MRELGSSFFRLRRGGSLSVIIEGSAETVGDTFLSFVLIYIARQTCSAVLAQVALCDVSGLLPIVGRFRVLSIPRSDE